MDIRALKKAILKTLSYRSIFRYPLTLRELFEYLICDELKESVDKDVFMIAVNELIRNKTLSKFKGYYSLGKVSLEQWVTQREKRESYSREKYRLAKKMLSPFLKLKMVKFIGVTGSVAFGNATKNDDIDIFVICKRDTVWIVRFILFSYLKVTRRLGFICPNIFIDECSLAWKDKNIYVAHEAIYMKPLYNSDKFYEQFISKNIWIFDYFKNYPLERLSLDYKIVRGRSVDENGLFFLSKLNEAFMNLQLLYMKRHKLNVDFSPVIIHFLKNDHSELVLKKFESAGY